MMAGMSTLSSPLACCKAMSRAMKVPERPTPALRERSVCVCVCVCVVGGGGGGRGVEFHLSTSSGTRAQKTGCGSFLSESPAHSTFGNNTHGIDMHNYLILFKHMAIQYASGH